MKARRMPKLATPFNELDNVTDSYAWQNLDHGKQSSAVYQLASNSSAPELARINSSRRRKRDSRFPTWLLCRFDILLTPSL